MNQIPNIEEPKCTCLHTFELRGERECKKHPNIEETHNIEIEEYRYYQAPNVPIVNVQAQDPAGFMYELAEVNFHQQLQKARHDGYNAGLADGTDKPLLAIEQMLQKARERERERCVAVVRAEMIKYPDSERIVEDPYNFALLCVERKLKEDHSELDQPTEDTLTK